VKQSGSGGRPWSTVHSHEVKGVKVFLVQKKKNRKNVPERTGFSPVLPEPFWYSREGKFSRKKKSRGDSREKNTGKKKPP